MSGFRRPISMFLVCLVCLMSSGFGIASTGGEVLHEFERSHATGEAPTTPDGKPCDHGCVGHFSAHLFSAPASARAIFTLPLIGDVVASVYSQVDLRLSDKFFKPPRIS